MKIKVNNINLYYEVFGEGKPIILLHGNGQNNKIFDKLIENLQKEYKVYAIDSRCHGQSDNSKTTSYEFMRDDVIAFIKELKIDLPILFGFSDGGIIGLMIAIKEPNILSKLVVSGPNLTPDKLKLRMRLFSKLGYFFTRNKLFKLMLIEPNIPLKELHKISTPTIVLGGSNDIVYEEHLREIAENIKGGKLEILDHESHGSYINHSKKLYYILKKYL